MYGTHRSNGEEIKACGDAGITVTLPKPMTSCAKSAGRFGKQDFVYKPREDVYLCQAGEKLTYRFTAEEHGQNLRRYEMRLLQLNRLRRLLQIGVSSWAR